MQRQTSITSQPTTSSGRSRVSRFLFRDTLLAVALVPLLAATVAAQTRPALYGVESEPSMTSKLSSSIKSGFSKVSNSLSPGTKKAPDPISLSVPAKQSPELHLAVARMAEQSGDLARAEHHYRAALELSPNHIETLMAYAHMLDRQNKLRQAHEYYLMTVRAHPDNARAHNDLGICCARQGRLDEAVEALEKAIRLAPDRAVYRNNLATILVQRKRLDEAFVHLSAVHPPAVAYYNLGYLLQKSGDKRGAIRLFQEALAIDSSFAQARVWLDHLRTDGIETDSSAPPIVTQPARQPQALAQRAAPMSTPATPPNALAAPVPPVVVPPAGSAAPMPATGDLAPLPQIPTAPFATRSDQTPPQNLAPLPSITPLPPVRGGR